MMTGVWGSGKVRVLHVKVRRVLSRERHAEGAGIRGSVPDSTMYEAGLVALWLVRGCIVGDGETGEKWGRWALL